MNCAECEHAYSEPWPNKREVLRCGNVDALQRRGYVVCIYHQGGQPDPKHPAPVWCPRRKTT